MMRANHPENMLMPYLRAELDPDQLERVERHIRGCEQCRTTAAAYSAVAHEVTRAGAVIPLPDWNSYNAELYRKIAARGSVRRRDHRPLLFGSILGAAAATALAILILLPGRGRQGVVPGVDQFAMESEIGNVDLGLIRAYPVIEHLDLLENYEVIDHLDQVAPAGNDGARS